MSDSRITQAVAEVAAAVELLTNARAAIHELLEEDPAFTLPIQAALRTGARELFRSDLAASSGLEKLRAADLAENGVWHVSSLRE